MATVCVLLAWTKLAHAERLSLFFVAAVSTSLRCSCFSTNVEQLFGRQEQNILKKQNYCPSQFNLKAKGNNLRQLVGVRWWTASHFYRRTDHPPTTAFRGRTTTVLSNTTMEPSRPRLRRPRDSSSLRHPTTTMTDKASMVVDTIS